MRSMKILALLSFGTWTLFAITNTATLTADGDNGQIALLDDCDPRIGAGWNVLGNLTGCIRREGSVSRAEFGAFLNSPFSIAVVGHPSWTIAPTYSTSEPDEKLRVRNAGGRGHTFTEVGDYGGGFVEALNKGLAPVAECSAVANGSTIIAPGDRAVVTGLAAGNHKFQCCIHPWMRALVKVQPEDEDD